MQKKNIILFVFIFVVIAAGVFYYLKYYKPVQKIDESAQQEAVLLEKMGHPENKYQFDGQITNIDLANKTLTVKVDRVSNFTRGILNDYNGKSYNFVANGETKLTQMTISKTSGLETDRKAIAISDLKINDEISLIIPIEEMGKADNFIINSGLLMIYK